MQTLLSRDSIASKIVQDMPLTFLERRFWRTTSAVMQIGLTKALAAELEVAAIAKELKLSDLDGMANANSECEKRWEEWFLNNRKAN